MPRQAREKSKTGIYHIMLRGINRQTIFEDDEDYRKFLETLKSAKEKSDFLLYGYCLMGNHVHLLLHEGKESMSLAIQRLCSSFAYWYNWKYDRLGHLFQERYKSEAVENEPYLLTVLRYIHQNPVKAGLTDTIGSYKWSSYREYMYKRNIIDTEFIFGIFATNIQAAKKEFAKYMNEASQDACLDYEERHRITDDELMSLIAEQHGVKPGDFHLLERREKDTILHDLKAISGVTIRQLTRVTGVSKFTVEKA